MNEKVINLRKEGKTQREIASLLGISRTTVNTILRDSGFAGRFYSNELKEPETFVERDSVVAEQLGVSVQTVARARTKLGIKHTRPVNLSLRQNLLAKKIFKGCKPGARFKEFVAILFNDKTDAQKDLIMDFYFGGSVDKAYWRPYRTSLKKNLPQRLEYFNFTLENCVEQGYVSEE